MANKGAKKDSKHSRLTALCSRVSEYVVEIAFPVDKLCSASWNARMNKYRMAEPMYERKTQASKTIQMSN